jgi:hypothetical protein
MEFITEDVKKAISDFEKNLGEISKYLEELKNQKDVSLSLKKIDEAIAILEALEEASETSDTKI